jgi:hypothetical protein
MKQKNNPETPTCEYKGCLPHLAVPAYLLIWSLPSGPVVKWSCADHRFSFGGNRSYAVTKFETFANNQPSRSIELAATEEGRCFRESDDEALEATCVDPECANPAPYKGAWCYSCQSKWEDEQRAKALRDGRSINLRRGF